MITSRHTTFVLILLMSMHLFGQNRWSFGYLLKPNALRMADWTLERNKVKHASCANWLKAAVNPKFDKGGFPVDIWSIRSEPTELPLTKDSCMCIRRSTKADSFLLVPPKRDTIGASVIVLKLPYRGIIFGGSAITARYRFQIGSELDRGEAALTVAGYMGYTRGRGWFTPRGVVHKGWTTGLFAGGTTVDLTKSTMDTGAYQRDRKAFAISWGWFIMRSRNNLGLQLGLGLDMPLGDHATKWIYFSRPWIGLGVATNLGIFT